MLTNTKNNGGVFHKAGLEFGVAGAIVRRNAALQITHVLAAWMRVRLGDKDKVFVTRPSALRGPMNEYVEEVELVGKEAKQKRIEIRIEPDIDMMRMMGTDTPGDAEDGSHWGVLTMERVGQNAQFRTMMYRLDDRWEMVVRTGTTVGDIRKFLAPDFFEVADGMPSAWGIMHAALALFGGQEPDALPPTPAATPTNLAEAVLAETNWQNRRKRWQESSRNARRLTPEQVEAFRATLTDPTQKDAFERLLTGVEPTR